MSINDQFYAQYPNGQRARGPAMKIAIVVVAAAVAALAVLVLSNISGTTKKPAALSPADSDTSALVIGAKAASPQATRLAAAAVLKPTDLPGYASKPQTVDASDAHIEHRLEACVGRPAPTFVARNKGLAFTKGDVKINSNADIADSAASAGADLAALKDKGATCVRSELRSLLAGQGISVTSFTVAPVPLQISGSDGAVGFRLSVTATAAGHSATFTGYQLDSLVGQAEIGISVFLSGPTSYPLTTAVSLLTKATQRARAAA